MVEQGLRMIRLEFGKCLAADDEVFDSIFLCDCDNTVVNEITAINLICALFRYGNNGFVSASSLVIYPNQRTTTLVRSTGGRTRYNS